MSERPERREASRSGTERAAILLLTLGENEAAQVLKHMGAKEVQRIGTVMAKLANVSREEVHGNVTECAQSVESQPSVGVGADEFLRKVLVDALGPDKATSIIDRINIGRSTKGLEALKWMDPRAVAELIRLEHPQITAIVLAYLDPDQSAEVLQNLPANTRADVVARIATLDGVQPSALTELDDIMEKQFAGKSAVRTSGLGGAKAAAEIINFLEPSQESALMEQIEKTDEALAARIQDLVFVRDDLEAKGPVRLSEVEGAQKEILTTARKLAEAGTIALGGKGEEYV